MVNDGDRIKIPVIISGAYNPSLSKMIFAELVNGN